MIPKIIHYCWFGGNPLPEDAKKCIESWKKYLPDYTIKEWNESNFDINSNLYVKQAYEAKKFAFVADYVRLYALVKEGGIYMDTDVEVIKSFDPFLHHSAFSGFENDNFILTGMMASERRGKWAAELLEEYNNRPFVNADGSLNLTTNAEYVTCYMKKHGLRLDNTLQNFHGLITVYPIDYFCPKDQGTGLVKLTDNSVCIHHYACSWLPINIRIRHHIKLMLVRILGAKTVNVFKRYLKG